MSNYKQLPDTTKVWIYQSNQPFREEDISEIRSHIAAFVEQWVSHNRQLRAYGDVIHRRFITLMVDESQAGASGCSIDKSVYFLKDLQQKYGVDLFDRMRFSYQDGEQVRTVAHPEFVRLYREGKIDDETPVFDTLVSNKADFEQNWVKPLGKSWHKRLVLSGG